MTEVFNVKRIVALVLALMLCGAALAEAPHDMGMTGEVLITMFRSYLEPFGVSTYNFELKEDEKADNSIVMPLSKYCTLSIQQDAGMVTSFKIVSSEDDGSDQRIDEIMACSMGCLMLTNLSLSADDAIDYLIRLTDQREIITLDGLTYRFTTTAPFSTIVGLEVTLAE